LQHALHCIVSRHQALRTTFSLIGGAPRQIIAEQLSLELPLIDPERIAKCRARSGSAATPETGSNASVRSFSRAIDSRGLAAAHLNEHILVVTMHHIVTDGWSVGVFHQELTALYKAFSAGKPSPLGELRFSTPTTPNGSARVSRAQRTNRNSRIGSSSSPSACGARVADR